MSDFSDRPFAAGSLTGLRAFAVDRYGRLVGPDRSLVFAPGENVAECINGRAMMPYASGGVVTFTPYSLPATGRITLHTADPGGPRLSSWRAAAAGGFTAPSTKDFVMDVGEEPEPPKHVVGSADCSCGFYAYFDGKNDYAGFGRVAAIIEGYGVCTVGSRGFRASKARLLGLIDNRPLRRWLTSPAVLFAIAACNYLALSFLFVQDQMMPTAIFALLMATGFLGGATHRLSKGIPFIPKRNPLIAKVRKNYPDVPVYRTQRAALRAHPLTVPEGAVPTPDDEDFWTRPVTGLVS